VAAPGLDFPKELYFAKTGVGSGVGSFWKSLLATAARCAIDSDKSPLESSDLRCHVLWCSVVLSTKKGFEGLKGHRTPFAPKIRISLPTNRLSLRQSGLKTER
jgi:hypothetical protein